MKFINTDGMVFIGPGSEWFWTAVSGMVLAFTFIALYRQLRLQSSSAAIDQLDRYQHEWESERTLQHELAILVALRDGTDPTHPPAGPASYVANFWERIAFLTRRGHLDRVLLWNSLGPVCYLWWATLAPFVLRVWSEQADPLLWEHFEWMAGLMDEMDRRAGNTVDSDEARRALLVTQITALQGQHLVEQALRTVILAAPEPATVGQPPAATRPRKRQPAAAIGSVQAHPGP